MEALAGFSIGCLVFILVYKISNMVAALKKIAETLIKIHNELYCLRQIMEDLSGTVRIMKNV